MEAVPICPYVNRAGNPCALLGVGFEYHCTRHQNMKIQEDLAYAARFIDFIVIPAQVRSHNAMRSQIGRLKAAPKHAERDVMIRLIAPHLCSGAAELGHILETHLVSHKWNVQENTPDITRAEDTLAFCTADVESILKSCPSSLPKNEQLACAHRFRDWMFDLSTKGEGLTGSFKGKWIQRIATYLAKNSEELAEQRQFFRLARSAYQYRRAAKRYDTLCLKQQQKEWDINLIAHALVDMANDMPALIPINDHAPLVAAAAGAIAFEPALAALANDSQNIHTVAVQSSTQRAIDLLLARAIPVTVEREVAIVNECHTAITEYVPMLFDNVIIEFIQDFYNCAAFGTRYRTILIPIWQFITTHESPEFQQTLKTRFVQEVVDGIGMCSQGKMSRLVNVLQGFDVALESCAPLRELFQNKIALVMELPEDERPAAAHLLFVEYQIPEAEQGAWLEALA